MQPLDLNLSSHPFRNNTLLWAAHGGAIALLLLFTAWNVRAFLDSSRALGELRGQVTQNERLENDLDAREQRAQVGIGRHDLKELSIRAATANDVIFKKALSWTRLFNLLETVVPHEVKTVSIRPVFGSTGHGGPDRRLPEGAVPVAIEGSAQSLEAFLEFERSLLMDSHFDQVEPERSDVVEGGETLFGVRFLYFPDGRPARKEFPALPHVLEAAGAEPASPEEAEFAAGEEGAPAPVAAPPAAGGTGRKR